MSDKSDELEPAEGTDSTAPSKDGHEAEAEAEQPAPSSASSKSIWLRLWPLWLLLLIGLLLGGVYLGAYNPEAWYTATVRGVVRSLVREAAQQLMLLQKTLLRSLQ